MKINLEALACIIHNSNMIVIHHPNFNSKFLVGHFTAEIRPEELGCVLLQQTEKIQITYVYLDMIKEILHTESDKGTTIFLEG